MPLPRALAPAFLAALLLAGLPAGAQLPTLGDPSDLSSASERKIGEKIARELYRDPDYLDDPVLADYVQSLWLPLLAAARARGELSAELDQRFAWTVLLGKDRSINAFALPGGWLGLHLGLIGATSSRDELASVLAHELSHVTQRHISRMMTQQSRQAPLLIAAMILGALAASKNPEAGNAVMVGGQALAQQGQLNFSRDMEREADRVGYGILVQAGFDPQGAVGMFEKLQQAARINDNGSFPYLRTHPMNTERMADMQTRAQQTPRAAGAVMPPTEHAMMAARARVLSAVGADVLRGFIREAESPPASATSGRLEAAATPASVRVAAVHYAAALAASRLREPALARRWQERLATLAAGDPAVARHAPLLEAEIALAAGEPARAAAALDDSLRPGPTRAAARAAAGDGPGRAHTLLAAQADIQRDQPERAAERLQTWVAVHPRDAAAWQALAHAYRAQGQSLRAVRAEAEVQVATLDYAAARDRLRAAQDLARELSRAGGVGADHIEASIIDTRARQVDALLREQALER